MVAVECECASRGVGEIGEELWAAGLMAQRREPERVKKTMAGSTGRTREKWISEGLPSSIGRAAAVGERWELALNAVARRLPVGRRRGPPVGAPFGPAVKGANLKFLST